MTPLVTIHQLSYHSASPTVALQRPRSPPQASKVRHVNTQEAQQSAHNPNISVANLHVSSLRFGMVMQRRYSVTGQTRPAPDVAELKTRSQSPKPLALDTSVPTSSCSLCDGSAVGDEGSDLARGRPQTGLATIVSKRSPSSPNELPLNKMARYRSTPDHHAFTLDVDTDPESDYTDDLTAETTSTSLSTTPEHSTTCILADGAYLDKLQLKHDAYDSSSEDDSSDDSMEHLALSPPHSRHHSLDYAPSPDSYAAQAKWLQTYASVHIEDITLPDAPAIAAAPTFLTLPPEIRHHIYRHCDELVFKQPLLYCIATAFDKIQHPLAAVSRLVRSEALAMFYSHNTWTIKVEFRMMYEGFRHWVIRLGEGAAFLRLIDFSVRGTLFKPQRTHTQSFPLPGQFAHAAPGGVIAPSREELYSPPDGDASFKIDLSEKYVGGRVQLVRNDGTTEAGDKARLHLQFLVQGLWDKRRSGTLNGQDWVSMVDQFIPFVNRS